MRAREFTIPRAAGCIIRAADTGRWCLQQRSDSVTDPGVWSTWGGGREPGETLEQTVRRELAEEGGYRGPLKLEPLMMSSDYATYIAHVPHEFEPQLNSESQDSCWVEAGEWPEPLHPGLARALAKIKQGLTEAQSAKTGIYQTDVLGAKAYHAKCMEPNCNWESKRFDSIKQAQAAAEKHAKSHFKQGVAENFADGKNPGRKGLSRRVGIPKKATLARLSKIAKSSTGERRRMAQWQLNMRRGKARKNK